MLVNLGLGLLGVKVKDTCHFAHIIFLSLSLNVQPVNSFVLIITWFVWVCGNAPSNKYNEWCWRGGFDDHNIG